MPYRLLGGMLELCQPSLFMQCKSNTHKISLNIYQIVSQNLDENEDYIACSEEKQSDLGKCIGNCGSDLECFLACDAEFQAALEDCPCMVSFDYVSNTKEVLSQTVHLDAHATTLLAPARIRMSTKC